MTFHLKDGSGEEFTCSVRRRTDARRSTDII